MGHVVHTLPVDEYAVATAEVAHRPQAIVERDLEVVATDLPVVDADLAVLAPTGVKRLGKAEPAPVVSDDAYDRGRPGFWGVTAPAHVR